MIISDEAIVPTQMKVIMAYFVIPIWERMSSYDIAL